MKITGLILWVQDNTLAIKFYKKLGFEITESTDQHSTIQLGDFQITLVSMRDDAEFTHDSLHPEKGRGMYLYIHVDDVDAAHAKLKKLGITPSTPPRDWDWGNREFIVKDPDGYKLCFWQKIS